VAEAAAAEGTRLEVVKLPEAKRGFVLLPRRWVVERSFAWAMRCRRLVKDYERYATTLAGFHVIAFVGYMLKQAVILMQTPSRGSPDSDLVLAELRERQSSTQEADSASPVHTALDRLEGINLALDLSAVEGD
jgi:hypothetical protein